MSEQKNKDVYTVIIVVSVQPNIFKFNIFIHKVTATVTVSCSTADNHGTNDIVSNLYDGF